MKLRIIMKSLIITLMFLSFTYSKCLENGNWEYSNKRVSKIINASLCIYDSDKKIVKILDSNGNVLAKLPFNGIAKRYSENGKLKSEVPHVNGERSGLGKAYFLSSFST